MGRSSKQSDLIWRPFRRSEYRYDLRRGNIIAVIRTFFRELRRCHQRIWKGYCDYDLFSIDSWFLGIMPNMLEEFRNTTHGYPSNIESYIHAVSCEGAESDETSDKADEEGMNLWKDEIGKIVHLLKEASEDTCSRQNPYAEEYGSIREVRWEKWLDESGAVHTRLAEPANNSERELEEKYFAEEKRLAEYRNSCKDEAFALLSKWFFDLWD